ncbi:methylaspartate mutase [Actinophytocola gossypii]|uniref:Methylaspartate mutase n=1 Tax=Actinophytocola gossypii TaxID=2812003 RepID=A0ABT2JBM4_9PSEU|nr:methylaspartate mutase [Actinophytocola gossypii]MCT2585116.1 methylaspartate mutase [Actinophytocola gossypii]
MTAILTDRIGLHDFVRRAHDAGELVVQPRMGFGLPERMRAGLVATKTAPATTVGTLTLDSYTRIGDLAAVERALAAGSDLNGYPIASHPLGTTRAMLAGVRDAGFPVQVRHGSATPSHIFAALVAAGLDATEGGPVSYCLPYGRVPLEESVREWSRCCELFAHLREHLPVEPNLETFGGCMMGQLCPPGLLVALSVLEALFFRSRGVRGIAVSYAQQANPVQDQEAVFALRRLCAELLPDTDWHVVVYAYMGLYPVTPRGARRLLTAAAELARATGAERLIVKTVAESERIPTIAENVDALTHAATRQIRPAEPLADPGADSETYQQARAIVDAVRDVDQDLGRALLHSVKRGYLDVPYCRHPDNLGRTRSYLDRDGTLRWADPGLMPIGHLVPRRRSRQVTSAGLMDALGYVRRKFDSFEESAPEPILELR